MPGRLIPAGNGSSPSTALGDLGGGIHGEKTPAECEGEAGAEAEAGRKNRNLSCERAHSREAAEWAFCFR